MWRQERGRSAWLCLKYPGGFLPSKWLQGQGAAVLRLLQQSEPQAHISTHTVSKWCHHCVTVLGLFLSRLTVLWLLLWMTKDSQCMPLYKLLLASSRVLVMCMCDLHNGIAMTACCSQNLLTPGSETADPSAMWVRRSPAWRSQQGWNLGCCQKPRRTVWLSKAGPV